MKTFCMKICNHQQTGQSNPFWFTYFLNPEKSWLNCCAQMYSISVYTLRTNITTYKLGSCT